MTRFEKDVELLTRSIAKTASVNLTCRVLVEKLSPSFAAAVAAKLNDLHSDWSCVVVTDEGMQLSTLMQHRNAATVDEKVIYLYTQDAIAPWANVHPYIAGTAAWVKPSKALMARI